MQTSKILDSIVDVLDVTILEKSKQQQDICSKIDGLNSGESILILSHLDPKLAYFDMIKGNGGYLSWDFLEQGPVFWKVLVRKSILTDDSTLGELVAADIRIADIFLKYGLDFCCGGKQSLKAACLAEQLDVNEIEEELQQLNQVAEHGKGMDYNRWQLDFLVDYIYNEHHLYWYKVDNEIAELMTKVVNHHVVQFPWLRQLSQLFDTLRTDLNVHFKKEEEVLFPYIKELVQCSENYVLNERMHRINVANPIVMMEADHQAAGVLLAKMRNVTTGYTLPVSACTSFQLLFHKLQALETDLHQHIHLENNILFPKALLLQRELLKINECTPSNH